MLPSVYLQKVKRVMHSALRILVNSAQYEVNHAALYSLKILNDLLQFMKAEDSYIQATSTLIVSLLIRAENAHLVRSNSESGAVRYLLERLEAELYREDCDRIEWASTTLLKALSNIALNDTNKAILVHDGLLPILRRFLVEGDLEEKLLAATLVWSLSFQDDNKYLILADQALIKTLKDLSEKGVEELKVKATGALYQLEITQERICRVAERQTEPDSETSGNGI